MGFGRADARPAGVTHLPLLVRVPVLIPVLIPVLVLALLACETRPAAAGTCGSNQPVIAIDAGHTLNAPGATSARGRTEFSFNQLLAGEVVEGLAAAGYRAVIAINGDGRIRSLDQRAVAANRAGATLFLSIHHDAVQPRYLSSWLVEGRTRPYSDLFNGYSLFISGRNPQPQQSERFATLLGTELRARGFRPTLHHAEPIAGENRPLLNRDLGVYRFDDLVVLRKTGMAAVLLEAGVIVNRDEELRLADAGYRARMVDAVVAAVGRMCGG